METNTVRNNSAMTVYNNIVGAGNTANLPSNTNSEGNSFKKTLTDEEKGIYTDPISGKKYIPQSETIEAYKQRRAKEIKAQRERNGEYSKDLFLKLFVSQLKYQDPLEPMDNKEMMSQMAMFTNVEQISNLNKSFTDFVKDFKGKDKDGKDSNVLVEEIKKLNANIEKMASSIGFDGKENKLSDNFEQFLGVYQNSFADLLGRISSLENEVKNLAKLI